MNKEKSLRTIYLQKQQLLQGHMDYLMELEFNPHLLELLWREENECLWDENFKNIKERFVFNVWKEQYKNAQTKMLRLIEEYNEAQENYERKRLK